MSKNLVRKYIVNVMINPHGIWRIAYASDFVMADGSKMRSFCYSKMDAIRFDSTQQAQNRIEADENSFHANSDFTYKDYTINPIWVEPLISDYQIGAK